MLQSAPKTQTFGGLVADSPYPSTVAFAKAARVDRHVVWAYSVGLWPFLPYPWTARRMARVAGVLDKVLYECIRESRRRRVARDGLKLLEKERRRVRRSRTEPWEQEPEE